MADVRVSTLSKWDVFNRLKEYFLSIEDKRDILTRIKDIFFCKRVIREVKAVKYYRPEYIQMGIGSWYSMHLGNSKGNLSVRIVEKDKKSYIVFDFDFKKDYIAYFFIL